MIQPRQFDAMRRGLDVAFRQGGEQVTWYKFITGAPAAGWAGQGETMTFATAQANILSDSRGWSVGEKQDIGGRGETGLITILMREPADGRDRIGYRGKVWDIGADPEPASLAGILFYRVFLRRAGA